MVVGVLVQPGAWLFLTNKSDVNDDDEEEAVMMEAKLGPSNFSGSLQSGKEKVGWGESLMIVC